MVSTECLLFIAICLRNVGDRELLAVKLALEKWRHWLEGTTDPFLILTNHRNLECIRISGQLNLRQARCALFFTGLNFTLLISPSSKNIKAVSMIRERFFPECADHTIIAPMLWDIDVNKRQALEKKPAPATCPPDHTYSPTEVRDRLLTWAHTSLAAGHPGITPPLNPSLLSTGGPPWRRTLPAT